jgi:hypothetical protein
MYLTVSVLLPTRYCIPEEGPPLPPVDKTQRAQERSGKPRRDPTTEYVCPSPLQSTPVHSTYSTSPFFPLTQLTAVPMNPYNIHLCVYVSMSLLLCLYLSFAYVSDIYVCTYSTEYSLTLSPAPLLPPFPQSNLVSAH